MLARLARSRVARVSLRPSAPIAVGGVFCPSNQQRRDIHHTVLAAVASAETVAAAAPAAAAPLVGPAAVSFLSVSPALAAQVLFLSPMQAMKQFKETGAVTKMLYPTVIYKWYMINLAAAHLSKVQKAIATFGGRSKHKMIVCSTDFAAVLFVDVDPSQVPSQMKGGLPASAFAAQS